MNDRLRAHRSAVWEARVRQVLKTRPIEQIRSRTDDGIEIDPLYFPSTRPSLEARAGGVRWEILQRVDHPDPAEANELATTDVADGASGLVITFAGAPSARGFGVRNADARTLGLVLRNVALHAIALRLEAGRRGLAAAEAMREVALGRSINPERARLAFGIDPIGTAAATGEMDAAAFDVAPAAALAADFNGPVLEADGRPYHDGGGSEAQELGSALATAVSYLRALEGRLADQTLVRAVGMTLSAGADIFLTVAKFRAARMLWEQVLTACGAAPSPLSLHGEASWRMMTRYDPHVNILRNVAAAAAAGLGGASSFCAVPFSLVAGLPDQFARRMARNLQIILMEEAGLHQVADPAAGSGYIDFLTEAVAERAWAFFQEIEKRGGMSAALAAGYVQGEIRKTSLRRAAEIATRKRPITGVTAFAALTDGRPSVLPVAPATGHHGGETTAALAARRDAEDFENLRAAADAVAQNTGRRPRVFAVDTRATADGTLGNFLASGGLAVAAAGAGQPVAEGFRKSGTAVAAVLGAESAAGAAAVAELDAAGAGLLIVDAPVDSSVMAEVLVLRDGMDRLAGLRAIGNRLGLGDGAQ